MQVELESAERKRRVVVKVEYEMPPEERLFSIDGEVIAKGIEELKLKRIKNVNILVRKGLSNEGGHASGNKDIVVWQDNVANVARSWYGNALGEIKGEWDEKYFDRRPKQKLVEKMITALNFFPHRLAGIRTPRFWSRSDDRIKQTYEIARNSHNEEEAIRMTKALVGIAFERKMSMTTAHEIEHLEFSQKELIIAMGIFIAGIGLGTLAAVGINEAGGSPVLVSVSFYGIPFLTTLADALGVSSLGEKDAHRFSVKYFRTFMDGIKINPEVFDKKVFEK
jgi:hypothetical protein